MPMPVNFVDGALLNALALNPLVLAISVWQGGVNANNNSLSNLSTLTMPVTQAAGVSPLVVTSQLTSVTTAYNIGVRIATKETANAGLTSNLEFRNLDLQPFLAGAFNEPRCFNISLDSPTVSAGATISGGAALRIAAQNGTGITGMFGIQQVSAGDPNYLAGKLGVGTTTPAIQCEIANGGSPYNLYLSGAAPSVYLGNASGVHPNGGAGQVSTGLLAIATATGNYGLQKGDLFFGTQSFSATNTSALRFMVPFNDTGAYYVAMSVLRSGFVGIGSQTPTSPLQVVGVPNFASDTAAGTGGLTTGAFYANNSVVAGSATLAQVITALNALCASAVCRKL